jgi:hypothetical protein
MEVLHIEAGQRVPLTKMTPKLVRHKRNHYIKAKQYAAPRAALKNSRLGKKLNEKFIYSDNFGQKIEFWTKFNFDQKSNFGQKSNLGKKIELWSKFDFLANFFV